MDNIAIGHSALRNLTIGSRCFALGKNAGRDNISQDDMVYINDDEGNELLAIKSPEISEVLRGAYNKLIARGNK